MGDIRKKSLQIAVKSLFRILLLSMLFSFQMAITEASTETVVKVEPYESFQNVSETFTVNITIIDVQNLYGVEIVLRWNASILRVVDVDVRLNINESHPDGVLYTPVFIAKNNVTQEEGRYILAGTSIDPAPPFNGSGNIVRIVFVVTAIGNCTLDLSTKLADWPPPDRQPRISWPIEHATMDGFFIISEFPQTITLLLFMILLTLAIILSKKRSSIKLEQNVN